MSLIERLINGCAAMLATPAAAVTNINIERGLFDTGYQAETGKRIFPSPTATLRDIDHDTPMVDVRGDLTPAAKRILEAATTIASPAPQDEAEAFFGAKRDGVQQGQEVRLNSCAVWMTVLHADCCEVDVAWFDGTAMQYETLPLAAITTAEMCPF